MEWILGIAVASILVLMYGYKSGTGSARVNPPSNARDEKSSLSTEEVKKPWWHRANICLNPIYAYMLWGAVIMIISAVLMVGLIWIANSLKLNYFPVSSAFFGWLVFCLVFAWPLSDKGAWLTVPPNYGAVVTFLGMITPVWLSEGVYPPLTSTLFFGIYGGPVKGLPPAPNNEAGLVYVGQLAFPIWDDPNTKEKSTTVSNNSKDKLVVTSQFTFTIQVVNPRKWIRTDDAPLILGDRARAALRDAVAFFPALDAIAMKSVFASLLMGDTILTSFIREQVEKHPEGAVIQNRQGQQLYTRVERDQTIEPALTKFASQLKQQGQPAMLRAIRSYITPSNSATEKKEVASEKVTPPGSDEPIEIAILTIEKHIPEVLDFIGVEIRNVSVANFALPGKISEEAVNAAAEAMQRDAQIQSAKTQELVRQILALKPGENAEWAQIAQMLAAAQDNPNVRVNTVVVPGGDKISRAAAILGSQQQNNERKDK